VYEALVSPGLTKARSELTKFPALEKFLTQYDPSSATVQVRRGQEAGSFSLPPSFVRALGL
jgi:hypothetical protein